MMDSSNIGTVEGERMVYQIRIQGHLDDQWTGWFGGASITLEDSGNTLLTCPAVDQAALHGLLKKVPDLGMPLVSVNRIDADQVDTSHVKQKNVKREAH